MDDIRGKFNHKWKIEVSETQIKCPQNFGKNYTVIQQRFISGGKNGEDYGTCVCRNEDQGM
jgi:hypothetical protein